MKYSVALKSGWSVLVEAEDASEAKLRAQFIAMENGKDWRDIDSVVSHEEPARARNLNHEPIKTLFSALTPAHLERLTILSEECSEVIKCCTKIIRHGWESLNPKATGDTAQRTNRQHLAMELGDLFAIIDAMGDHQDFDQQLCRNQSNLDKSKYHHHQD